MGMSTIKSPVGPASRRVYARRRLVVLLGFLALVAVVILIIVRPGSADNSVSTAGPSTATPGAAPAPACTADTVVVAPVTSAATYSGDEVPEISLTVTNNGSDPCTINAGTSGMIFTITSGSETYWTSSDCQTGAAENFVVLAPAQSAPSEPLSWDRTRSAPDTCTTERAAVPAGGASYHLSASLGGIASTETAQFILN